MNRNNFTILSGLLFIGAAAAFATGQYVLGAWQAFGCVALGALACAVTWFEDRPATVVALEVLTAALVASQTEQARERADVALALSELRTRVEALQTYLSAAQAATRGQATAGIRSPVRPPLGSGR